MQNQIPNNWQKVKLGDRVDITSSKRIFAHEYLKDGIPFYRGKEIIEKFNGNKVSIDLFIGLQKFKDIEDKFGIPQEGDMLLTSVGTLGIPYLVGKDEKFYFKDGNLTWFRNFNDLDNRFLYLWIQSAVGKAQLLKHTIGSSQQALTIDGLKKIEINLPPKDEQEKISSTLFSLSNKIEANNKIAKTLEEMAQVIFKEWFVNFRFPGYEKTEFISSETGKIPKGWNIKKLEDLIKLRHGFAFKSEIFTTNITKNIVVRMGNFQELGGLQFSDNTFYLDDASGFKKYILAKGDMVMIFSDITREGRLIGKVGLVPNDNNSYFLNQRVAKIEHEEIYNYFLMSIFNSKLFHQHCLARADSATVLNLKNEHIYEYPIIVPEKTNLNEFSLVAKPIYEKISSIKQENQKLITLRDLLLPKLMKGEIEINA